MSNEEENAIEARVLLEYERAKRDLALLRAKAAQWHRNVAQLARLLDHSIRTQPNMDYNAREARRSLERDIAAVAEALSVEAVFALDSQIVAALARFNQAETAKKALGFV